MHALQRKVAIGLAVLAGTVGVGAGLAAAQTDGTTLPTSEAPASPPSDQAPEDGPRRDGKNCPEKGGRGGGGTEGSTTDAVMRLSRDAI